MNWNALVEALGPRLYNYFLRRGYLREASDLSQEVFSRLYQKIAGDQFDPSKGSIDSYAFGIARFVAMENFQNSQIYKSASDDFDWENLQDTNDKANIETVYEKKELIELFLREIKSLNPIQQDILTLYMDDDMTLEAIAELLKVPTGTVKSHLFRAKENLKGLLQAKGINL